MCFVGHCWLIQGPIGVEPDTFFAENGDINGGNSSEGGGRAFFFFL